MRALPILATALAAPGDLNFAAMAAGRSAIVRLAFEAPVAVGAPFPGQPQPPEGFPFETGPRALMLAVEALRRLELDPEVSYGLILGMSSTLAEPAYLEIALADRDSTDTMATLGAFRGEFPLDYLASLLPGDGPRVRVDSACASGSDGLILAHQWIESGHCDEVVVIAAASMLDPVGLALFGNLRALNDEDDLTASRPFDRRRRGFVMGEGAAAVWLSGRRNVRAHGWLVGYGQSMNAFKLTDMPSDVTAMEDACRQALGDRKEIAYISAHGTSTPANDVCETRLYKSLLGARAPKTPTSSIKSMTGHCLGASSLIETIVTLEALQQGLAPPTINLEEPDPECDLDYVPNEARKIDGNFALVNAFAFGGHNSSLLLAAEKPA